MNQQIPLPPPFLVDATYEDEFGEYKVISIEGTRMTFVRPDRTQAETNNIALKATIHKRILRERQNPKPSNYRQISSGSHTPGYKYEDVTHLVAEVIDEHSKRSAEFITHSDLKKALLAHPLANSIINGFSVDHFKTPEAWAGVVIAGFSKERKEGAWDRFERKKMSKGHAWRVKRH